MFHNINEDGVRGTGCIYRSPGSSEENNQTLNDIIIEAKNHLHAHLFLVCLGILIIQI